MLKYADRVRETTSTTGTGQLSLNGAVAGFRTFVAGIGDTHTCVYAIVEQSGTAWEMGLGTVTAGAPDKLSRDAVFSSSNGGALVNFGAGTKDVRCELDASHIPVAFMQRTTSNFTSAVTTDTEITPLTFVAAAGENWVMDYALWTSCSSTQGARFKWSPTGGFTGAGEAWHDGITNADNAPIQQMKDPDLNGPTVVTQAAHRLIKIHAILYGAAAGSVKLFFSSLNAANTVTVNASTMRRERVA